MTAYKRGFIITTTLTILSLVLACILYYGINESFWCNVLLGVFGSSLLTSVTTIIGYHTEKRAVMEEFYTESLKLLSRFNRYQIDYSLTNLRKQKYIRQL